MRRQKNTQQVKEQGQNTPDLTNEEEIGSLTEKELRIMIVRMIQNLGNRIDKMQETFNKDVEELKRNQATMKNTSNEIKNTLDGRSKKNYNPAACGPKTTVTERQRR